MNFLEWVAAILLIEVGIVLVPITLCVVAWFRARLLEGEDEW